MHSQHPASRAITLFFLVLVLSTFSNATLFRNHVRSGSDAAASTFLVKRQGGGGGGGGGGAASSAPSPPQPTEGNSSTGAAGSPTQSQNQPQNTNTSPANTPPTATGGGGGGVTSRTEQAGGSSTTTNQAVTTTASTAKPTTPSTTSTSTSATTSSTSVPVVTAPPASLVVASTRAASTITASLPSVDPTDSDSAPTETPRSNAASSGTSFFKNKAAVAATFGISGILVIGLTFALGTYFWRKRSSKADEEDFFFSQNEHNPTGRNTPEFSSASGSGSRGLNGSDFTPMAEHTFEPLTMATTNAYPDRAFHYGSQARPQVQPQPQLQSQYHYGGNPFDDNHAPLAYPPPIAGAAEYQRDSIVSETSNHAGYGAGPGYGAPGAHVQNLFFQSAPGVYYGENTSTPSSSQAQAQAQGAVGSGGGRGGQVLLPSQNHLRYETESMYSQQSGVAR